VHPLSNLIASDQVHGGDLLRIEFDPEQDALAFMKEAENMPVYAMMQMIQTVPLSSAAASATLVPQFETQRAANAKSHRTRL